MLKLWRKWGLFSNKTIKRSLYYNAIRKELSTKNCESLQPIKMVFNVYDPIKEISEMSDVSPVIIMHGLFGSKNNWNSLSKSLHSKTKKTIIVVDARNHGYSPHSQEFSYEHLSADILHLMNELAITKATILGHSMGGRAAMTFALSYPEYVENLIVVDISPVNSSCGMIKMKKYFDALNSVHIKSSLTMSHARKTADEQLSKWIPEYSVRQFLLTNLIQKDGCFNWRVNLNALEKSFEDEIMNFPQVSSICNKPALFLGGLRSDYLRFEDHADIQKIFPSAEFQYIDAGHWLHSERPTEFINIVTNFLQRQHSIN